VMKDAGFTNVAEGETVIFFALPDSPVRVDFLPVDSGTLAQLLSGAVQVTYGGASLKVPCLPDLLAMKLFALKGGHPRRKERDMMDIVNLTVENGLAAEADLKTLCERYANVRIYEELAARIREMKNA
jgi:hypothetical protein